MLAPTLKKSDKVKIAGGEKLKINLNDAVGDFVNLLIDDSDKRNEYGKDYKIALVDFFITCN